MFATPFSADIHFDTSAIPKFFLVLLCEWSDIMVSPKICAILMSRITYFVKMQINILILHINKQICIFLEKED